MGQLANRHAHVVEGWNLLSHSLVAQLPYSLFRFYYCMYFFLEGMKRLFRLAPCAYGVHNCLEDHRRREQLTDPSGDAMAAQETIVLRRPQHLPSSVWWSRFVL
jgi:hypothetical protein